MSVNRYKPHILVLPEDDANRQIANGFLLDLSLNTSAIQVLREAGGWLDVMKKFTEEQIPKMRQFPKSMIALLIDFDDKKPDHLSYEDRLNFIKGKIPDDLKTRVFVLGSRIAPEQLKKDMNKHFEEIGEFLAKDCNENTNETWGHHLLKHNENELKRMRSSVKPFLFS